MNLICDNCEKSWDGELDSQCPKCKKGSLVPIRFHIATNELRRYKLLVLVILFGWILTEGFTLIKFKQVCIKFQQHLENCTNK